MAYPSFSNQELWDLARKNSPQFRSQTSEGTLVQFTERGFEAFKASQNPNVLDDWFELSLRAVLQQINVSRANNTLSDQIGEYYENQYGGVIQRMAVGYVKPVTPGWINVKDGDIIDPFVIKKVPVTERMWNYNFNYQSVISVPDDALFRTIFISEYGMSDFISAQIQQLENGYNVARYNNTLECLNSAINSTQYPLQASQKVNVSISPQPTSDELKAFILQVKNLIAIMTIEPQSAAFNAAHFMTVQDKSRLRLVVRPGIKNAIEVELMANAYNAENLQLPIEVVEVPHFGGLKPFKEAEYTTPLYPVYDKLGTQIGYAETENAEVATVEDSDVFWKDPNADVLGLIMDKGLVFYSRQNPYSVETIRNPRARITNYWASSPNNTVATDYIYNCIVLKNA